MDNDDKLIFEAWWNPFSRGKKDKPDGDFSPEFKAEWAKWVRSPQRKLLQDVDLGRKVSKDPRAIKAWRGVLDAFEDWKLDVWLAQQRDPKYLPGIDPYQLPIRYWMITYEAGIEAVAAIEAPIRNVANEIGLPEGRKVLDPQALRAILYVLSQKGYHDTI